MGKSGVRDIVGGSFGKGDDAGGSLARTTSGCHKLRKWNISGCGTTHQSWNNRLIS